MRNKIKALILGLLILVPLFVFIFIYTFGEHHFGLRTYLPERNAKGEVVRTAAGDTLFKTVPEFELTDQSGNSFSIGDLEGKLYVVSFFSTDCQSSCRKMNAQLVRVQEMFQNNPDVALVSISAKPQDDSTAALQEYASRFNADTTQWHFLTGNRDTIYGLAQEGFELAQQKNGGPEDFIHSSKLMLVDKEQKVRGVYEGTDMEEVDRLMLEINVLLDEYSKRK